MIFLVHSETAAATVGANLGLPEYSYFFVLKAFRPMLEELGVTIAVQHPEHEVDRIWRNARAHGEDCIFLTFSPPHRTFVPLHCPTIPIFAWEFDSIPVDVWEGEPRNDWRLTLNRTGRAITHSQFAVQTVRKAMGKDFDIISLPAPIWDNFAPFYEPRSIAGHLDWPGRARTLKMRARVYDTRKIDLADYVPLRSPRNTLPVLPEAGRRDAEQQVVLDGVIYTSIFCPLDGRKNSLDLVLGFCAALADKPDATLVLKLTHRDCDEAIGAMLREMARLPAFRCRVVIIDGYLADDSYMELAAASHYAVNASHGEGQCLPLMEYMSAGKPAIAPYHTSTLDYVTPQNGFLVRSSPEPTAWPHDPRRLFKARRQRIDYLSLLAAYAESYQVAKADPVRYAQMAEAAHEGLRPHCSRAVIRAKLASWLLPQGLSNAVPRSGMALTA